MNHPCHFRGPLQWVYEEAHRLNMIMIIHDPQKCLQRKLHDARVDRPFACLVQQCSLSMRQKGTPVPMLRIACAHSREKTPCVRFLRVCSCQSCGSQAASQLHPSHEYWTLCPAPARHCDMSHLIFPDTHHSHTLNDQLAERAVCSGHTHADYPPRSHPSRQAGQNNNRCHGNKMCSLAPNSAERVAARSPRGLLPLCTSICSTDVAVHKQVRAYETLSAET